MEFGSIPQAGFSVFTNLASTTSRLEARCTQVLDLIKNAFAQKSVIGADACSFEIIERTESQPAVATLTTPLGNGRFVQGWTQREKMLCAELIFEREQRDQYDRRLWEPVWGLTVPLYDPVHSGTGSDALRIELGDWAEDDRSRAFVAAISILSAIVHGPLISKA